MRVESSVTSISWIPSEAVQGLLVRTPFEQGVTHYDDPPPDALEGNDPLEELRAADRFRFANHLQAWIEVDDGRVVAWGQDGGGRIGSTTIRLGRTLTFEAFPLPDLRSEPEAGDGWVRFRQTAGGRTGLPAPRRVHHPPFLQMRAPVAWTTLELTLHADGRSTAAMTGASPFPRHWVYGPDGLVSQKSGLVDFKEWYRHAFGKHTPWGDEDAPAVVAAAETALERQLSLQLMRGGSKPKITTLKAGELLTEQGSAGEELYLVLDGILSIDVDGEVLAEVGPGALLGERAILEGGARTSTARATTPVRVAVARAEDLDREKLLALREGHRREEQRRS